MFSTVDDWQNCSRLWSFSSSSLSSSGCRFSLCAALPQSRTRPAETGRNLVKMSNGWSGSVQTWLKPGKFRGLRSSLVVSNVKNKQNHQGVKKTEIKEHWNSVWIQSKTPNRLRPAWTGSNFSQLSLYKLAYTKWSKPVQTGPHRLRLTLSQTGSARPSSVCSPWFLKTRVLFWCVRT